MADLSGIAGDRPRRADPTSHAQVPGRDLYFGGYCFTCGGSVDLSEEHTSELQSRFDVVCRLLLEKKKDAYMKTVDAAIRNWNRSRRGESVAGREGGQQGTAFVDW